MQIRRFLFMVPLLPLLVIDEIMVSLSTQSGPIYRNTIMDR